MRSRHSHGRWPGLGLLSGILVLALSASPTLAGDRFEVGLFGGTGPSSLSTSLAGAPDIYSRDLLHEDQGLRPAWAAGLHLAWRIGDRFSLAAQPSLLLCATSYPDIGQEDPTADLWQVVGGRRLSLSYTEVPVLLRYRFHVASVEGHVMAGPVLAWLRSATSKVTVRTGGRDRRVSESKYDWDYTPEFDERDYGVQLGVGARLPLRDRRWTPFVEVRYSHGLANIVNPDDGRPVIIGDMILATDDVGDSGSAKNRGLRIAIGALLYF